MCVAKRVARLRVYRTTTSVGACSFSGGDFIPAEIFFSCRASRRRPRRSYPLSTMLLDMRAYTRNERSRGPDNSGGKRWECMYGKHSYPRTYTRIVHTCTHTLLDFAHRSNFNPLRLSHCSREEYRVGIIASWKNARYHWITRHPTRNNTDKKLRVLLYLARGNLVLLVFKSRVLSNRPVVGSLKHAFIPQNIMDNERRDDVAYCVA